MCQHVLLASYLQISLFFYYALVRCSCPYRQVTPRPPSAGPNHPRDLRDSGGAFRVQTGRDRASQEEISSPRGAQALRDSRDLRDLMDSKDSRGENTSPRGAHRTPASEAHQQHPHRSDPHQQHPHRSEAPHYVSRPVPPLSPAAALPPPAPSCQQPPPQAAPPPSTRSASPPFSPRRGATF